MVDTNPLTSTSFETAGTWVLGHNQREGASHMYAGARAQLQPSRFTEALSTLQGRIAARTMLLIANPNDDSIANYATFHAQARMEVTRRVISRIPSPHPVIVNPQAGYSPTSIWLAEEFPDAYFVDIDTPETIEDKKKRLDWYDLPQNLSMRGVDLSHTPLHEALSGMQPDVVVALGAFCTPDSFAHLLRYLHHVLADGGWVIAPFPYAPGIENLSRNMTLFQRFAGKPRGIVKNIDSIHRIMDVSGYSNTEIFKLSDLAREMNKPTPADVEVIAIAQALQYDNK